MPVRRRGAFLLLARTGGLKAESFSGRAGLAWQARAGAAGAAAGAAGVLELLPACGGWQAQGAWAWAVPAAGRGGWSRHGLAGGLTGGGLGLGGGAGLDGGLLRGFLGDLAGLLLAAAVLFGLRRGSRSSPARGVRSSRLGGVASAVRPGHAGGRRSQPAVKRPGGTRPGVAPRCARARVVAPGAGMTTGATAAAEGGAKGRRALLADLDLHDLGPAMAEALADGAGVHGATRVPAVRRGAARACPWPHLDLYYRSCDQSVPSTLPPGFVPVGCFNLRPVASPPGAVPIFRPGVAAGLRHLGMTGNACQPSRLDCHERLGEAASE